MADWVQYFASAYLEVVQIIAPPPKGARSSCSPRLWRRRKPYEKGNENHWHVSSVFGFLGRRAG
jgi:hypothetical protein